jgi:hypothetical protein
MIIDNLQMTLLRVLLLQKVEETSVEAGTGSGSSVRSMGGIGES